MRYIHEYWCQKTNGVLVMFFLSICMDVCINLAWFLCNQSVWLARSFYICLLEVSVVNIYYVSPGEGWSWGYRLCVDSLFYAHICWVSFYLRRRSLCDIIRLWLRRLFIECCEIFCVWQLFSLTNLFLLFLSLNLFYSFWFCF